MSYDICLFKRTSNRLSQYQTLGYATDIIKESLVQTSDLKGKRQLIIIRREDIRLKHVFAIYNYVLLSGDTFGLCFAFKEYYPKNIKYIFSFCSKIVSEIIKEGKILYVDDKGNIKVSTEELSQQSAILKPHLEHVNASFDENNAKLFPLSSLTTYNKIFQCQRIVHELSDTTWSMTESLNYNNIVVFTEVLEDENINNYRNVVRRLANDKKKLATELEVQKDQYAKLLKEKNRYKYVVALAVLLFISGICIYAINYAKKQEKHQFEVKEKAMSDSITEKDSVITDIQYDLTEKSEAYDSLQQQHNNLQNSYNDLVQKKTQLEKEISEIRDNISADQPFVLISTNYNKSEGNLTVTYQGLVSGSYTITIKALYENSSYDCGKHSVSIEKGKHSCVFHIGKRQSKKFALFIGKKIVGGEIN